MDFKETLTPNQQKVYETVKAYLNRNPFFTLNDLYRICKKTTSIPANEINLILTRFVNKKFIIDGSKLTKVNILKNEIRKGIYNYISKNPALNFTQILKQFNIGSYAARWHLGMLRKFGFIRQKRFKIYNVHFSNDFPENKEELVFSLRNQNAFKIFLCLKYAPLNSNNIAQILHLNYSTIQYHIKDLFHNKLIITNGGNKFLINPEFTDFLNQFYDLTVPEEFMKNCDDLSDGNRRGLLRSGLEFQDKIESQLDAITSQIKQFQDNSISQQSFTQTIEKIENRLLIMEETMRNLYESLKKLKEIIE